MDAPTASSAPTAAGLAAAAAGLGAAEWGAQLSLGGSVADAGARYAVDKLPVPLVELGVRLLRGRDKPLLRGATPSAALGLSAAAGRLPGRGPELCLAGLALGGALALGRLSPRRRLAAVLSGAAGAAAALSVRARVRSRRAGAAWTAAGLAGAGAARLIPAARGRRHKRRLAALLLPIERRLPAASDGAESWGHPTPLLTPVEDFYAVDVNFGAPLVDPGAWRLKVGGLARDPIELGWGELIALGAVEFDAVMVCIHDDTDGRRAYNARWVGIPLERVAAVVGPSADVVALETRAVDGSAGHRYFPWCLR